MKKSYDFFVIFFKPVITTIDGLSAGCQKKTSDYFFQNEISENHQQKNLHESINMIRMNENKNMKKESTSVVKALMV